MGMSSLQSRFRGCLIGGAIGDALGYPVEFLSAASIRNNYGPAGITRFDIPADMGKALVSDDTQMTLFTAAGMLAHASSEQGDGGRPVVESVRLAYLDWCRTQHGPIDADVDGSSWLCGIERLYHRRAPGVTCMEALSRGGRGSMASPVNDSKGCGGVMRVAPCGLDALAFDAPGEAAIKGACEAAAITHGHPLGWMSAGALAFIVNRCVFNGLQEGAGPREVLLSAAAELTDLMPSVFADYPSEMRLLGSILAKAVSLAGNSRPDLENIQNLGEGWVAEEALAIALYAAARHPDNFSAAVIAAVNHGGDSDSTGAICGNIMGALLGDDAIDSCWKDNVELKDVIYQMADDLYGDYCRRTSCAGKACDLPAEPGRYGSVRPSSQ